MASPKRSASRPKFSREPLDVDDLMSASSFSGIRDVIESHFAKPDAPGATPLPFETDPTRFQYVWEPPQTPVSVRLSADLIERLEKESLDIFRAITNRGSEIGGILLGHVLSRTPLCVLVQDYEPFACGFTMGPTYRLSVDELEALKETVARHKAGSGVMAVGFFRSNTRPVCALSEDDLGLFDNLFPGEHNVFLLAKPFSRKPCVGAFFVREQGRVRAESSYQEFPFSRAELEKTGALQPAIRVILPSEQAAPVAPAPAPATKPEPIPVAQTKPALETRPAFSFSPRPELTTPPATPVLSPVQPGLPRQEPPKPFAAPVLSPLQPSLRRQEVATPPAAPVPKPETKPVVEVRSPIGPVPTAPPRQEIARPPAVPVARPVQPSFLRREAPKPPAIPASIPEAKFPEPVAAELKPTAPAPMVKPEVRPPLETKPAVAAAPVAPQPKTEPRTELEPASKPAAAVGAARQEAPEPAVVPAPEFDGFHFGTTEEPRSSRRGLIVALAIVVLVVIAVYAVFLSRRGATTPTAAPSGPSTLALTVEGSGSGVAIHWDVLAPGVSSAPRGKITIRDGGVSETFDLTSDDLKRGVYTYKPRTDDLAIRLEAGQAAVGTTRVLGATRLKKPGRR